MVKISGKEIRVILIGCSNYAKDSHIPALQKHKRVKVIAVVDLASKANGIKTYLKSKGLWDDKITTFISIGKDVGRSKDVYDLYKKRDIPKRLTKTDQKKINALNKNEIRKIDKKIRSVIDNSSFDKVDGIIISTYGVFHGNYIRWALSVNKHILVDKPLTVPRFCSSEKIAAKQIWKDFKEFNKKSTRRGSKNTLFMLATQRRYQPVYQEIAKRIRSNYKNENSSSCFPITFVQCLTSDGWWLDIPSLEKGKNADSFNYRDHRSFNPSISGGGKLTHTGYHLIDIITWLMRFCEPNITEAKVYTNILRPRDTAFILEQPRKVIEEIPEDLAEVNAAIQIEFRNKRGVICFAQFGMLHEGLSLKDSSNKLSTVSGRTKQEIITINQGPIFSVWMRRIAKLIKEEGTDLGYKNHFELLFGNNPFETGRNEVLELGKSFGFDSYVEENKAPTNEFLNFLSDNKSNKLSVISPVSDHSVGIKLLSAVYQSATSQKIVKVRFNKSEWSIPPQF